MNANLIQIAYLIAAVLFIVGIKGMTKPKTAVAGNQLSAVGMLIAVVVTLLDRQILTFEWIIAGVVLGSLVGVVLAVKIRMTAMPQLIALLNGFGGGASVAVAGAEYLKSLHVMTQQPATLLEAAQQVLAATATQGGAMGVVTMIATGLAVGWILALVGARFAALILVALLLTRAWARLGLLLFARAGSALALLIGVPFALGLLALVACLLRSLFALAALAALRLLAAGVLAPVLLLAVGLLALLLVPLLPLLLLQVVEDLLVGVAVVGDRFIG